MLQSIVLLCVGTVAAFTTQEAADILNGHGTTALRYIDYQIRASEVLSHFPRCETTCTSPDLPCAKSTALIGPSCHAASTYNNNGVEKHYCQDGYVCCGGDCRPRTLKECEFSYDIANEQFDSIQSESLNEYLSTVDVQPEADEQLNNLLKTFDIGNQCMLTCNGWDVVERRNISCPETCTCKSYNQPELIADDIYSCSRQLKAGYTLFSSGSNSKSLRQGQVVCPALYSCQDKAKCMNLDEYESLQGIETPEPTTGGSGTSTSVAEPSSTGLGTGEMIGIIVGSLVAVGTIIGAVVFVKRKKSSPVSSDYTAMH